MWQLFYTWRIHILSESFILVLPIVVVRLSSFAIRRNLICTFRPQSSLSQLILGMYASLKVHSLHFIPQCKYAPSFETYRTTILITGSPSATVHRHDID